MRRTTLTDAQRTELQTARHDASFSPRERDRVEMLLLSAAGWSPPRIAAHFGCSVKPVHAVLDGYPTRGLDAVRRHHPGPQPNAVRRQQIETALTALLAEDRTWTAAQLAAALGEQQLALSTRQTRRYLHGLAFAWRRTTRTLRHKQDPVRVATARQTLTALKKGQQPASSASAGSTRAASAPVSR